MILVVNANILFSALIKDGITRKMLLFGPFSFYTPEFLILEFIEHIEELEEKTGLDRKVLKNKVWELVQSSIKLVPTEDFKNYISPAEKISPDKDDVLYFALSLSLGCPIWSNDLDLKKKQKEIAVWSTTDLLAMISKIFTKP